MLTDVGTDGRAHHDGADRSRYEVTLNRTRLRWIRDARVNAVAGGRESFARELTRLTEEATTPRMLPRRGARTLSPRPLTARCRAPSSQVRPGVSAFGEP